MGPKEIRGMVDEFVNTLITPTEQAYGFEALAKTMKDTRATCVDTDWKQDRILGLVEMQEIARFCEHTVESSFCGSHHSAIENPKRKSPSMIMTRAPTRDFDREALARQPEADEISPKASPGHSPKNARQVDDDGDYSVKTPSMKEIPVPVLQEEWISLTFRWREAKTDTPAIKRKIQRELCRVLACNDKRVVVQYVGQGYIHVALGGKRMALLGSDPRSAAMLGIVIVGQFQNRISLLRQGFLKDAELYNGEQDCYNRCIPEIEDEPALTSLGAVEQKFGGGEGSLLDNKVVDETPREVEDLESARSNVINLNFKIEI